jgi:hypothetical protein
LKTVQQTVAGGRKISGLEDNVYITEKTDEYTEKE